MTTGTLPDSLELAPASSSERRAHVSESAFQYCLLLLLLPLLAIPATILLGRSDFFLHHGASVWVQANDQVFSMRDRDCDVLIYGDSTAMTGIDPDLVQSRTGLRTCNIAVTNAVLAVTGDLTLDHFLASNARPRILLVQLSPDGFLPGQHDWRRTIYPEGLLELLRHGTPEQVRSVLVEHPQESIAFGGYAAGYTAWFGIRDAWFHATGLRYAEDTIQVRNGFFTPPSPARTECLPTDSILAPATERDEEFSRALVAGYRQGYADRAGRVLVNVAPIPACDEHLQDFTADLSGITSNPLVPLPVNLFNDGRHYTARGSEIVSALVALELTASTGQTPDPAGPDAHVGSSTRLASGRRPRRGLRRGRSQRSPGTSGFPGAPADGTPGRDGDAIAYTPAG